LLDHDIDPLFAASKYPQAETNDRAIATIIANAAAIEPMVSCIAKCTAANIKSAQSKALINDNK